MVMENRPVDAGSIQGRWDSKNMSQLQCVQEIGFSRFLGTVLMVVFLFSRVSCGGLKSVPLEGRLILLPPWKQVGVDILVYDLA